MVNKKYAIVIAICLTFFIFLGVLSTRLAPPKIEEKQTNSHPHYHAGFQVYLNGLLQDYSGLQYMHLKPCTAEDTSDRDTSAQHEKENEIIERAHLHDGDGDVVHVHRDGVMWSDLLTYLKVPFNDKPVALYINGVLQPEVNGPIKPYTSAQFFIGTIPEDISQLIDARVTEDRILAVEKKSESCGQD